MVLAAEPDAEDRTAGARVVEAGPLMGDHQRAVHRHYDDRGAERIEAVAPALGQIDIGDSAVQPMRRVNGEVCGTESSQTPRWRGLDSNF